MLFAVEESVMCSSYELLQDFNITYTAFLMFVINNFNRIINQLTPWSTDLPEKPTGPQLVNKFPAFNGTQ
jgi:hypothetical protein